MSALEDFFNTGKADLKEQAATELLGDELMKKHSPGMFAKLLDILDRPGNATRALLVGKLGGLKGLIPFAQVIEDLTGINVAMDPKDRVRGAEVIEQFFGKQQQRPGKLDPVDVLGVLVEIVADPLWLVGGAGLTKLGKARGLVGSAMTAGDTAKDVAVNVERITTAVHAAKAGQPLGTDVSKHLADAIRLVAKTKGPIRLRKASWTAQVARGERGLVNVLGRPVVKGKAIVGAAEKAADVIRTGPLGGMFLSPHRRTTIAHGDLGKEATKIRDAAQYDLHKARGRLEGVALTTQKALAEKAGLGMDEAGELAIRHYEAADGIRQLQKQIDDMGQLLADPKKIADLKNRILSLEQEFETVEGLAREGVADLRKLAGEARRGKGWLARERDLGLPVEEASKELGYVHRVQTPEFIKESKTRQLKPRTPFSSAERSISAAPQHGRIDLWMDKTRPEIAKFQKEAGYAVENPFDPDLLRSLSERAGIHANVMAAGKTIQAGAKKYGKYSPGKALPGYFSYQQLIDSAHGVPQMESITKLLPVDTQLPKDVARALFDVYTTGMARPEVMEGYWKLHEGATKLMKGMFTVPFPAFHARNTISNKIQNWLEGMWNPEAYRQSAALQLAARKTHKIMTDGIKRGEIIDFASAAKQADWPDVMAGGRKMSGAEAFDIANRHGILGRTISTMSPEELPGSGILQRRTGGIKRILTGQDPVQAKLRGIGGTIEDHDKLAHFLDRLKDGYSPADAAASAKTSLFDYNDLSPWEKKWLRDRFVFFYTFAKKNIGLQARHLVQTPAKQAVFAHLAGGTPRMQDEAKKYPDYWNERLIVPTGARNAEGQQQVLTGLGTPIEEAFGPLGGPGTGAVNRLRRVASRAASRLNPLVLKPIEFATGRNMYFDQPITNWGQWAQQSLPTGRLTGTIRSITEGSDSPGSKALGVTTGIRYRPFDAKLEELRAKRRVARNYLQNKASAFTRYYLPKDVDRKPVVDLALQVQ